MKYGQTDIQYSFLFTSDPKPSNRQDRDVPIGNAIPGRNLRLFAAGECFGTARL